MERVWRRTWRPKSSDFGDTLGGYGRGHLEIHSEAVINSVRRFTWMPCSIRIRGVLGGGQSGDSHSGGGRSGLRCNMSRDSIHWLTHNCRNVKYWLQQGPPRVRRWETGWEQETLDHGMRYYSVYAELSICSDQCMQYSVNAVTSVSAWSWLAETQRDNITSCS